MTCLNLISRIGGHKCQPDKASIFNNINEFRQYGEILDPLTLEPIPIHPVSPRFSSPAAREDVDEEVDLFEIVFPQAFPNGWLLLLSLYFVKNTAFTFL